MIGYLLRDAFRRYKPVYLFFGAIVALLWLMRAADALDPTATLSFSFGASWLLGVYAGVFLFATREIGLLPVPRRTVWRAQWILSTVVATVWTTAAKLAAAVIGALPSFGSALQFVALSACLDFLYNGVLLATAVATGVAGGRVWEEHSPIRKAIQATGLFVALMAGFVWGFVLRPVVPTTWSEVSGLTAIAMGAAFLVSVAVFFYPPNADEPRPGRRRREIRSRQVTSRSLGPGRLAGVPRLIADDLKATARMAVMIPLLCAAAFVGVAAFNPSPGSADPLEAMKQMGLLPLRDETPFAHCLILVILGLSLVNNRLAARYADPISPLLRQLRVLPIGVRQLNTLLIGRRLLGWLVVWAFFLIPHVIVFRSAPSTLRLDILVYVAGADALIYSVLLRWMKWFPTFWLAMPFGFLTSRIIDDTSPLFGVALGLACLLAAFAINHDTLTTRHRHYQPMALPPFSKHYAVR